MFFINSIFNVCFFNYKIWSSLIFDKQFAKIFANYAQYDKLYA